MSLHHVYVVTAMSPNTADLTKPFFTQAVFQLRKDADAFTKTLDELLWSTIIVRWENVR